jgi:peptide/nickel transport system ATP-binding protein
MSSPLLQVNGLTTSFYGEEAITRAVDDISFEVRRGEILGIVGESGSGKSVTSLSIMRLVSKPGKITSGSIRFFENEQGVDLLQLPEAGMRHYRGNRISMIFQEPMTSLNPVFSCGYQVEEALQLHQRISKKEARAQTLALFEQVQLPQPERIYRSYPHELSGGQKQRVMIAMAMSCNPDILIADEPTTALDVTVQKTILELMQHLQKTRGMSVIFITHDLGVIAEIADRVMVMYKGKIVEQGSVTDIFRQPQHPYTKGLLACRPPLDKQLRRLPVIADFLQDGPDGSIASTSITVQEAIVREVITPKEKKERLQDLMSKPPLLEVHHLKTWFPVKSGLFRRERNWVKAVDDVSFEVYPGETLGLVGESGCGKTTLGRSILRLQEPSAGSILYKGRELLSMNTKELQELRKEMQIIFQDPYSSLNPRMTIGAAIMEPMTVYGLHGNNQQRREKVMELLEKVNLHPDHFRRYPHEFSGGQRQRIVIARALSLHPSFIICDESVSALDVSVQAQVLNLLMQLREEFGFTYIFISHDLSVVKFMSDRMVVMNQGRIEEMGPAEEIYTQPTKAYTQRLIDAVPKGEISTAAS